MIPTDVKPMIARLDPGSFTSFVSAVVSAETERLAMPANNVVFSEAMTEADGGLDASLIGVPLAPVAGPASALPHGDVGLQCKATKRKNVAAFDLATELRKPGPKRVLSNGGTYILVSSQDFNDAQRRALESAVLAEAEAVLRELAVDAPPKTRVFDAHTLAMLARIHPATVVAFGLDGFEHAQSLPEVLIALRSEQRPFEADEARRVAVERLRSRLEADDSDPLLLMLHGDPGAGKTRTIAHALDVDDIRDRVVYVNGTEGLQTLVTTLARLPASHGVLFIDEVDDHDVTVAARRLAGTNGRWRVVSVYSRRSARWISEGGRNVVLPPLDAEATRKLVLAHARLTDAQARLVAEVAAGFPELAFRLADELRASPDMDLVRLAAQPQPRELLDRALSDDETRRHLAPLALFAAVGFEDELRHELEAVAGAFDLDYRQVERFARAELDARRFVSRAGRYRMISPLLVAVWLATDLIERTPNIVDRMLGLPPALQTAFTAQLEYFGPASPHLPEVLQGILGDNRFRSPGAFDEAAGRFLRASAAIVPEQVAQAISALVRQSSSADLASIPRREVVNTLTILLWWPSTWSSAIDALYRLANDENETWTNNATGTFVSAFSVFLSGTTVPFEERAAWLRDKIADASDDEVTLLAGAAAAGLSTHHVRTVVGFRGGGEPEDWRPTSQNELVAARRMAWELLLDVVDRAPAATRDEVGSLLAQNLTTALVELGADRVATEVLGRDWSTSQRIQLTTAARHALRYAGLVDRDRPHVRQLIESLTGQGIDERLNVVLGTPLWDLAEDREGVNEPEELRAIVSEVDVEDGSWTRVLAVEIRPESSNTAYAFFRLLAAKVGWQTLVHEAVGRRLWIAVNAALTEADNRGSESEVDQVLLGLARREPMGATEVLLGVQLTEHRARLLADLVDGDDRLLPMLRQLVLGARIQHMDGATAQRVVQLVAQFDTDAAITMIEQGVSAHPDWDRSLHDVALAAAGTVLRQGSHMAEYELGELVKRGMFSPGEVATLWKIRVEHHRGLADDIDRILTEAVLRDPRAATPTLLAVIRQGALPFTVFQGTELGLLSKLASVTSAESVWTSLQPWSDDELRLAIHHMTWSGNTPDSLVRLFLISDRLSGLETEATVCFYNTLGVVVGPYYVGLQNELERARSWHSDLRGTSAEPWARQLIEGYERDIAWHRQRHEEEHILLR